MSDFVGNIIRVHSRNKPGKEGKYYRCTKGKKYGYVNEKCELSVAIKLEIIEGAFMKCLKKLLEVDLSQYNNEQKYKNELKKLEINREKVINNLSNLADEYLNKKINLYDYNQLKKQHELKLRESNDEIERFMKNYKKENTINLLIKDLKEIKYNSEYTSDLLKKFVKYIIIGGRYGNKKNNTLIRFVYNDKKKNLIPTNEEIIDKSLDSSTNNLVKLIKFKYNVKFVVLEKNMATGKSKLTNKDNVLVIFEYENDAMEVEKSGS